MSAQTQQRRRQQPAPGQESAIVAGRSLTFFAGRDESGGVTFRITFGRTGGNRRDERTAPRGNGRRPGGDTRAAGRQHRAAESGQRAPKRPALARTRAAVRVTARAITAPARLLKRGWATLRHRVMPGRKLTPKEQTEVKKFKYIGWAGLAPGLIGTGVTLGATAAGMGQLAPVVGLGASSVAAAINAPIQGYISAMLTRRLDRGLEGDTVDRNQNREINKLTAQVASLEKANARISRQLGNLQRQVGDGRTAGAKTTSKKTTPAKTNAKSAPAKQTGRGTGAGTKSGTGRAANAKGERSTARTPRPEKQPRTR
jgi:hypothetical protein